MVADVTDEVPAMVLLEMFTDVAVIAGLVVSVVVVEAVFAAPVLGTLTAIVRVLFEGDNEAVTIGEAVTKLEDEPVFEFGALGPWISKAIFENGLSAYTVDEIVTGDMV